MSEPVLITVIICLTVIFVSLLICITLRWLCILLVSSRSVRSDDEFLTINEFEEYEHIIADALEDLKDKLEKK